MYSSKSIVFLSGVMKTTLSFFLMRNKIYPVTLRFGSLQLLNFHSSNNEMKYQVMLLYNISLVCHPITVLWIHGLGQAMSVGFCHLETQQIFFLSKDICSHKAEFFTLTFAIEPAGVIKSWSLWQQSSLSKLE